VNGDRYHEEVIKQMSTSSSPVRSQYIICLAGHIDHGKSALVHALTGGTVDRLPEEKRRGITIELGFSHFDDGGSRFALIDVPGHERFIHTMVAGASGVDAALLVIAADDSVMPQTREHLALLELLGVRRGVVAVTKCDLADEEQLEMVELEVAELVAPTILGASPRIRVSTHTGQGVEEVRQAIVGAARSSPDRQNDDRRFRLPIDRAFSAAGQGAVVTGTVWSGEARVGDTLHLLPAATPVRVRRLQSQGVDVEQVAAGERAAVNLAGIKGAEIGRGDELTTPHAFAPATRHLVQLRILADAARGVKHRQPVRLHLGANQVTTRVLMEQRAVAPGETAFAILRCESPVVAEYGQPFVLRQLSPARTIGGGIVIGPALRLTDRQNRCFAAAAGLASADEHVRLAAFIELRREAIFDENVESWIGLNPSQCEVVAQALEKRKEVVRIAGAPPTYVSMCRFRALKERIIRRCQAELERRRPASFVPLSVILSAMKRAASPPVLDALIDDMTKRGELVRSGDRVGLTTGPELSNRQRGMLTALVNEVTAAGPTPPTLKEFADRHGCAMKDLEPIVQVAVDEGQLLRLSPQLVMHELALEELRQRLADHFQKSATAKVGEMREAWGITRKHAVPIFEFFDARQITSRAGDVRSAGPCMSTPLGEVTT
jgi:selenocysteine-specific elongation factor